MKWRDLANALLFRKTLPSEDVRVILPLPNGVCAIFDVDKIEESHILLKPKPARKEFYVPESQIVR